MNDAPPERAPCAGCGTTRGGKNRSRPEQKIRYVRYDGRPFGFAGQLCATCRNRAVRHKKAVAVGRVPGKVGNPRVAAKRRERTPYVPTPTGSISRRVTPAEVAERLREVQEAKVKLGLRPRTGETDVEISQRRWAAMAVAARRSVLESRKVVSA